MNKGFAIAIWWVLMMAVTTIAFDMISVPNSTENLIGVLMLVAAMYLSIKTRFLISLIRTKDEK